MRFVICLILLLTTGSSLAQVQTLKAPFNPDNPTAQGFSLVFDDEFTSMSTIDCSATRAPGYNWYLKSWFYVATPCGDLSLPAGGPLTITPSTVNSADLVMGTAGQPVSGNGYVGQVFGASSGAKAYYFEANLSFDPSLATTTHSHPAFWADAIQSILSPGYAQWTGQITGYDNHDEDDFFEFDAYPSGCSSNCVIASTGLINWYGVYNVTCTGYCKVFANWGLYTLSSAPTWTSFNRFGQLWVLGTAANNYNGYVINYINGVPIPGRTASWVGSGGSGPYSTSTVASPTTSPPDYPFALSVIDTQDLVIMFSESEGVPLNVRYVRVYALF